MQSFLKSFLSKDEKIIYSKDVYFSLRAPDSKTYNSEVPFVGHSLDIDIKDAFRSYLAGLFITSTKRLILVDQPKVKEYKNSKYRILLDLPKNDIKKTLVKDCEVETGGLPVPGVELDLLLNSGEHNSLLIGTRGYGGSVIGQDEIKNRLKQQLTKLLEDSLS